MGRPVSLIERRYGRLTVLSLESTTGPRIWNCLCDCGKKTLVRATNLRSGNTLSCGCLKQEKVHPNLMGQRFGKLTVIDRAGVINKQVIWRCLCDCGKEKTAKTTPLKHGKVLSCGCLKYKVSEKITFADAPQFIGRKFGRLTVIALSRHNRKRAWTCLCACGNTTKVETGNLFDGTTTSCGCFALERSRKFRLPGETGALDLFKSYKRDAKRRGIKFNLEFDEFKRVTSQNCIYCGALPSYISSPSKSSYSSYYYNGLDRIDNNQGYEKYNVEPCCKICNTMKWNLSKELFLKTIKSIYLKQFKSEEDD